MGTEALADDRPAWLRYSRPLALVIFAWSLPVSLFGMQAGVIVGGVVLAAWSITSRGRNLSPTPLDRGMLALILAILLSLLMAPHGVLSFHRAAGFWVLSSFYVTWFMLDSQKTLRRALTGIFVLACAAAIFAVYQSISGHYPLGHLLHPHAERLLQRVPGMSNRIGGSGFFYSRLSLAHVLLFPLCWSVSLAIEPQKLSRRLLLLLVAAVIGMGILFTWTRAALAVSAVALLVIVFSGLRGGHKKALILGVLALAMLLAASICVPRMFGRLAHSFSGANDWGRLTIWQTALDLASDNPVAGVGFGNFVRDSRVRIAEQARAVKGRKFSASIDWAHSNLLTLMAECGMLGAFALCLLCLLYFRACAAILKTLPPDARELRGFVRGALVSVAAFLAVGFFHDTLFHAESAFIFWFTTAASLAAGRMAKPDSGEPR